MPWFKVDDGFHGHPKVVELSLESVGVWTLAGSWCAKYLTDGEIGLRAICRLGGSDLQAMELVHAGLWTEPEPGLYQFKDWDDYQPLKAEVEAEREAARERMKRVRGEKKGVAQNAAATKPEVLRVVPDVVQPNTDGTSPEVRVTPSLPFPSLPSPAKKISTPNRKSSCPKSFPVTDAMAAWARENNINADLREQTARFLDHHASKGSTFVDWTRAWQNWMRNAKDWAKPMGDPNAKVPAQYGWANQ